MYKKALRLTACGLASALLITGSNTTTYAAPVAGVTSAMEVGASNDISSRFFFDIQQLYGKQ